MLISPCGSLHGWWKKTERADKPQNNHAGCCVLHIVGHLVEQEAIAGQRRAAYRNPAGGTLEIDEDRRCRAPMRSSPIPSCDVTWQALQ
jgi:hypothetical protein